LYPKVEAIEGRRPRIEKETEKEERREKSLWTKRASERFVG